MRNGKLTDENVEDLRRSRSGEFSVETRWLLLGGEKHSTIELRTRNTGYAFQLQKRSDHQAWALTNVDTNLSDGVAFDPMLETKSGVSYFPALAAVVLHRERLEELVGRPTFEIKEYDEKQLGQKNLHKFTFMNEGAPFSEKERFRITQGWFVLDSDKEWLLHSYSFIMETGVDPKETLKSVTTGEVEYESGAGRFPHLTRTSFTRGVAGQPASVEVIQQYKLDETFLSADSFRLAFFGFPEPEISRSSAWYSCLGLGGIMLAAGGLLISRWLRRREAGASFSLRVRSRAW
jgi:hypothetical protein